MEITYVDVPTNFISRKSESPSHKPQQLNYNMSIPLVQIPLFEKMSLYKESEKKIEAQKALKLKLKALGKFNKSGLKPQKSPRAHEPAENKTLPGLPTVWSYRVNQTLQDLRSKNLTNITLNNSKPDAFLDKSKVLDDDPYKSVNSETDTLRAINNLAGNFFVKSHFTSPKAHRLGLSETNLQQQGRDSSIEGPKIRIKTLNDMSSPTPTPKAITKPQSPQVRAVTLGKSQELRRFVISPKRDISPEIPYFTHAGGSPRNSRGNKPSMLTLIKDRGTMSQNSLLNSFIHSKEKTSPTPTSPKTRAKLATTFYQDPSTMRLFQDQRKSSKRIEDIEHNFDIEHDVVLNSTPTISIPTETIYIKPQSSHQSPEPQSPEKMKPKQWMRSLQKLPTQVKGNGQKPAEKLSPKPPKLQKRIEALALKFGKKMTNVNPIFNVEALDADDPCLKQFVSKAQDRHLPPLTRRKLEMIIVRRRLLKRLEKIRKLKLTLQEVMRLDEIFGTEPYAKPGSKELLIYVKLGKTDKVKEILQEKGKYIVYDFDHVHLTSLHWAAKKGFNDIAKVLIDHGADVDAKDVIGRTPLYFAIQHKNEDLVKMLLANYAEPWSTEDTNYQDVIKNKEAISYYLSKMKKVHMGLKLTPPHQRELFWQREAIEFLNSYRHPLSDKKIEEKKNGLRWYKGALTGITII